MIRISILWFIGIGILINTFQVYAQDSHYWTEQFGNKSMLLSGTVNASVADLGLVFYNPGRLTQIENPAFVISAKVYELKNYRVTNGLGEGRDLKNNVFGGAPSLVAGTFKLPFLKNHQFAYSFLTRYRENLDLTSRANLDSNGLPPDSKYESISAKISSKNSTSEEWYGLTWSHQLTNSLSIGVSTFAFQRNKNQSLELQLQGLELDESVGIFYNNRRINYERYGLLWKIGIAKTLPKMNLGLTITTTNIGLYGKGLTDYEVYLTGVDSLKGEITGDLYVENYQRELPVKYQTPWSVSFGVAFPMEKSTLHITTEWFSSIAKYTVVEANPFISQHPIDTIKFRLTDAHKSIFNFGSGYEHRFSDRVEVYASFAADFSSATNDSGYLHDFEDEITQSNFKSNVFHLGGGISLKYPWAELTLGATHAFAHQEIGKPLDLGKNHVFESDENSTLYYGKWRFIVGFSFPFAENLAKKAGVE